VVSNTVFNAKGAFSGSGTLAVGPGWLNLHNSANTYSGAVTVTGKTADQTATGHVGPGGGGIGLWNGAKCFPSASSIIFTNTARLAFMDTTKCTVPNVNFVALAGETQSVSGGVYTTRSTMAGFTKTGAGTLVFNSPVAVTGTSDVRAGTLKVAKVQPVAATIEGVVAPQPVFSNLVFASGTKLDLSDNIGFMAYNLVGSPSVTNSGLFGVSGKWTLTSTNAVLTVRGQNATFDDESVAGLLAFTQGATFGFKDAATEAAFEAAAGTRGVVVARAQYILNKSVLGVPVSVPTAAAGVSGWEMRIENETSGNTTLSNTVLRLVRTTSPVEPDRILYVNVDAGATDTLNPALVTEYITNIVKQGAGTLVASALSGYTGGFSIEGGIFEVGVQNGAGASGAANTIYVGDGASLRFTGTEANILSGRKLVFEGAPAQGEQGKFLSAGGWVKIGDNMSLELRDDATMAVTGSNRMMLSNADIDLGGNTLTIVGSGRQASFDGSTFRNAGGIVVGQNMTFMHEGGKMTFASPASGTGSFTLRSFATLNLKSTVSAEGWTLYATNGNATVTSNTPKFPDSSTAFGWNGRVVFGGSEKLATYGGANNVSNTVFNLKGAVSGSGTLSVGPGWLNLYSANNTYSGVVTVNGQNLTSANPILAGGGGIGLWNGAACFPKASSITFTNTARLAFMDATACSVPNAKFVALAGETQSVSGGVNVARSTMAGFVKEGAGTLYFDAAVDVTGIGDVKAGTLKVANRINLDDVADQAAVLASTTVFSNLQFAAGTTFDLSDAPISVLNDLTGAPSITNVGVAAISGKWTLPGPNNVMNVTGENIMLFGGNVSGGLAFIEGATFDLADEAAFSNAVASAGDRGILVAYANWVVIDEFAGIPAPMPQPSANISQRWQMYVDPSNVRELRLRFAPAGGYAAWVSEKGLTGDAAAFDKETNGIKNGIRYAFDIDPASSTVGDPIIKVVFDSNGNPVVESRNLADGRDDVTFGVLATENLNDWTSATLVPMEKFPDGFWKPADSKNNSSYVFPSKMFFKYQIDIR